MKRCARCGVGQCADCEVEDGPTLLARAESAEAEEARLSAALLDMASERDVALADLAEMQASYAKLAAHHTAVSDEVAAWKTLAGALRNHESRIQGIIADVDWTDPDAMSGALEDIDALVNGPRPTSAQEKP